MGDLVLGAEAHHLPAREVGPIVRDDGMRKSLATYDVLSKEFNNWLPCDVGERTASTHFVK